MPQVLIRIDAGGEWPVVVDDDEALESTDGARWRFVAEVENRVQGHAIAALWLQQHRAGRILARLRQGPGDLNP